jgi:hypothetical protein
MQIDPANACTMSSLYCVLASARRCRALEARFLDLHDDLLSHFDSLFFVFLLSGTEPGSGFDVFTGSENANIEWRVGNELFRIRITKRFVGACSSVAGGSGTASSDRFLVFDRGESSARLPVGRQ